MKTFTVFENRPKSRIQYCERSELRLQKLKKCQNSQKKCYQIGQIYLDKNWWKMPKLKTSNATF